ncbi:MAG: orotidine-5'-phosphate decarboxylase [Cytophagales bacterium]|nr:orotidine-5'-phosphate decarboxylase [Cytophagales bacterium]
MSRQALWDSILQKGTCLCVGLDTVRDLLPPSFRKEKHGLARFNRAIIESTADLVFAYKVNTAFYEAEGMAGLEAMEETLSCIPQDCFLIVDGKRSDVGHSAEKYAEAYFSTFAVDGLTVSPFLGRDGLEPFLARKDKWTIILGASSNPGFEDFQALKLEDGNTLFEEVMRKTSTWGSPDHIMYVVGGTRPGVLDRLRGLFPDHFFLVPGLGEQGGSLEEVCQVGFRGSLSRKGGLILNSSRSILYADSREDQFARAARKQVLRNIEEIKPFLT